MAIIFGVKKFNRYLYGRFFTILTYHKRLVTIFGNKRGILLFTASRLRRWSIILSTYDYDIKLIKIENIGNADCLSRLPMTEINRVNQIDYSHIFHITENLPLNYKSIKKSTRKDKILNEVFKYCYIGWHETIKLKLNLKRYLHKRDELPLEHGCILWRHRILILEEYTQFFLNNSIART